MRILPVKHLLIPVIFLVVSLKVFSQELRFDSSSSPAVKTLSSAYNSTFAPQLHLYNGTEYREYSKPFEEDQPYFIQNTWSKGSIFYDGSTYDSVPVLYNVVTDQLIILGYNNIAKIQLVKEKVGAFTLQNHSFVHLRHDSLFPKEMAEGYYDVLASGKTSLLAKRTKNIQPIVQRTITFKVFKKDHYYVRKNNSYALINSRKNLFAQVSDKKKEVQQYLKANKLRYRKDPENTMIKVIEYYNKLTN